MTATDNDKPKDQGADEEHKLAKETIEDLDADEEEEARNVKGGSQGSARCQWTYTCWCSI